MPTVTDEYGRKREVSMEEIRRALANADPGSIMIQEVTTDIYTGEQTVRNIPVSRDGSFDLYGNRMRFNIPSYSGYTPPESKEERERRLKKEAEAEERRKQEIQEREAQIQKKVEEYRRTAESRYCCRSKLESFRTLEKKLPEKQAKLFEEETALSSERKMLERFQTGYSDQDQDDLLRATDISEHHRKLLLEKLQLRKQLETLGLFSFGAKKQIRNRTKEIDTEITDRIGKIDFLKRQIMEKREENISRVERAKNDFLRAADDALKYIGWRESCIPAATSTPKIWWNYERNLLPVMEYLESHSPCTINDIYDHHPYKNDISTQKIVSCFRMESVKPFYRQEMSGGRAYFYFVYPEDYQSQNPEDWELEARKIRQGK